MRLVGVSLALICLFTNTVTNLLVAMEKKMKKEKAKPWQGSWTCPWSLGLGRAKRVQKGWV